MLGVVITGHGGFASGLLQAVQQVIGPQEQCVAIDFPEGMCTDSLQQALRKASQPVSYTHLTLPTILRV